MRKLLGLIGIGAALTYFFHPSQGARRRAMVRGRFEELLTRAEEGPKPEKRVNTRPDRPAAGLPRNGVPAPPPSPA